MEHQLAPRLSCLVQAYGYGLRCLSPDGPKGMVGALKKALEADRTTVVEVKMDFGRLRA